MIDDCLRAIAAWGEVPVCVELHLSERRPELLVITRAPGMQHGAYRSRTLAWDAMAERGPASALAAALEVELEVVEPADVRVWSTWIARQPVVEHAYTVTWRARWWTDDGDVQPGEGALEITAPSGRDADIAACRRLRAELGIARPLELQTQVDGLEAGLTTTYLVSASGAPPDETIRAWRRDGAMADELIARLAASCARKLDVLLALHAAFALRLEHVDLADPRELDLRIEERRPAWMRPHELRQAWASGVSGQVVATVLGYRDRGDGPLEVMASVREAFGCGLAAAKLFVSGCCAGEDRVALETELRSAIESGRPGG